MAPLYDSLYLQYYQVVTFWEGEIVDSKNYTFFTGKWEATYVHFFSCFRSDASPLVASVRLVEMGGQSSVPLFIIRTRIPYKRSSNDWNYLLGQRTI